MLSYFYSATVDVMLFKIKLLKSVCLFFCNATGSTKKL